MRENEILTQILPQKTTGQFTIYGMVGNEQTKIISIEAINEKWTLKSSNEVQIINADGKSVKMCPLIENTFQTIIIKRNNEKALVFAEPVTNDRTIYCKVMFPLRCHIKIGRDPISDIVYRNKYASSKHAEIICEDNRVTLIDLGSLNGTYVNGKITGQAELHVGDVIYIMGLKIIIGKGFLAANNPDGLVSFNYNLFSKWKTQISAFDEDPDDENEEESDKNVFYRSPRFKRDIKTSVLNIDPPPMLSNGEDTPLMLLLGPSMPGLFITSVTLLTPDKRTASAILNASKNETLLSDTLIRFSLRTMIRESTFGLRFSIPETAFFILIRPSNGNGFVTIPTVSIPISFAILAITGAAPVPVPPPIPAVTNTM